MLLMMVRVAVIPAHPLGVLWSGRRVSDFSTDFELLLQRLSYLDSQDELKLCIDMIFSF